MSTRITKDFLHRLALVCVTLGVLVASVFPLSTSAAPSRAGANVLTNADMESGTTNWVVNGAGTLSSDTTQFHGGARSMKITGRTSAWNGIGQNVAVSNFPTSGQNYTVSVWVRSQTGTPTAKATLRLTASSTTYVGLASAAINSTGWTLVTGTVPVSWSGTLTGVLFYVETAAGTDNIYIDDASLANNAGATATPTRTPSGTPSGPTATLTRTNTPSGPTATRTNTPSGPTATPVSGAFSINAGGSATGSFLADQYYSGGSTYTNTATINMSQITSNPPPAAIFNTERYGAFTYTIPNRTAGSAQTVTLYFAETYLTAAGQRLFNVTINGATVLSNFDIYASAGGQNRAIARTFNTTANSSGQVVIQFITGVQSPKVNGLTVAGGSSPTPTPTATPTGSGGVNPSAGCGKARTLQNGTITIQSNGTRQYILRAPDNYNNTQPYRLIVAYHWLNGSAQEVANGGSWASETPYYGLWNLANNSTIFVAPVGLNAGWANTNGQDVTFTDAILTQVKAELCIDQSRIFATGFSYGAGMSYAIACARPAVFRGVALYSGAQLSGCSGGTTPIAYFASHGLSDATLNVSGGRTLRDHFVSVNGVTPQNPPEPAIGSGTHICTTYQGGSPAYPVTWCAFDGDHNPNPHDSGQSTSWVPQQVWNFILRF